MKKRKNTSTKRVRITMRKRTLSNAKYEAYQHHVPLNRFLDHALTFYIGAIHDNFNVPTVYIQRQNEALQVIRYDHDSTMKVMQSVISSLNRFNDLHSQDINNYLHHDNH